MIIRYRSERTAAETSDQDGDHAIDIAAFRTIFDHAEQAVSVHRQYKPLYVNRAFARLHGYKIDEIMAMRSILPMLSPADRQRCSNYYDERSSGQSAPTRYRCRTVHKTGRLIWTEIFVQPLDWDGAPAVQSMVIDTRHRSDEVEEIVYRATRTHEEYIHVVEALSEGFILYDSQHRLLHWNNRFVEMYPDLADSLRPGVTFEALLRKQVASGLTSMVEGDAEAWTRSRLMIFGVSDNDLDLRTCHGRWYHIREKMLHDGSVLVTSTDITDRKAAEKELAEERTLLRSIIDNIPDLICAKDLDGRFIVKNLMNARMMGAADPEETIGKTDFDYYPEDIAKEIAADDRQVLRHGLDIIDREQRLISGEDGTEHWHSVTKVPLKNADGDIVGLVACCRNISDRRRLEMDLIHHRDHLEELVEQRTAEIERQKATVEKALKIEREVSRLQRQFVSMVSHEFRTPLAIIDGNARRVMKHVDSMPPERMGDLMVKIRNAVKRLTELMESVLAAARLESGKILYQPSPCDVGGILDEVAADYGEIDPTRRIVTETATLPERFFADAKLLRQVFANLLSNAIKYSPDKTTIWIKGEPASDGGLRIAVRDEGIGIPKAELQKLFQRFFRASTSTGIAGSGIGLHLTRHLVQMHEGRIEVESEIDVGTTFTIHLPMTASCIDIAPETRQALPV